jgi:predicted lipoprotein with Yx(FWY)xxD motif
MRYVRIVIVAVALCVLAACSGESSTPSASDTSSSVSTTPSDATESSSADATPSGSESGAQSSVGLDTAKVQGVGTVLVDQDGRTVYLFTNDTGAKSTCTGSCASTCRRWSATGSLR